jgi:3',5'-cyclic AMP phosphodiesterase CpdA
MNLGRALLVALAAAVFAALFAVGLPPGMRWTELPADVRRATVTTVAVLDPAPGALALPLKPGSVRFAVIGDSGRGDRWQQDVADQMVAWRARFPFTFVVMLGDNIYGTSTPHDYEIKFERPYRALLEAGVEFRAAIGNHDDSAQIHYGKFNMDGRRYYTYRESERRLAGIAGAGVRFFVLDSRSLDPDQLDWLREQLKESGTAWKICYFHHPLYTSGRYRAGARALRIVLEPILVEGDVDVVLSGHEHLYERLQPQRGISYFTSGGAGSLRRGDLSSSAVHAKGFDTDYHFMLMEVSGNELYFQAISRTGQTVDAGVISRPGT